MRPARRNVMNYSCQIPGEQNSCLSQGLPKMEPTGKATKEVEIKGHGV